MAGLAAARALAAAGHAVTLLERDAVLGGKIRTARSGGFLVESGPDSFLAAKPSAIALCREVGLGGEIVSAREPRRVAVYAAGALHPLPDGVRLVPTRLMPILRSSLFTAVEKARIAADLVLPARPPAGDESVGSLIRRRLGRAALDRLVAPLIGGIYGADPEQLSAEATFPHLCRAERDHGSLIRGARAAMDAADADDADTGNAAGAAAPTARSPFVTLAGGMGSLIERVAETLAGHDLRKSAAVARLARSGAGYRLDLEDGTAVEAEGVVLAAPAMEAARILTRLAPTAASLLAGIEHVSTAVVSLGFKAGDLPTLDGHGFVVARDQPSPITACTWSSSKWPDRAPPHCALLRAYLGSAVAPVDLEQPDERLVAAARDGIARTMGVAAEPVIARVHRWPAAMPQYAVGHRDRVARIEAEVAGFPRLALAGAAYDGVGIPDAIASGLSAARRVAGSSRAAGEPNDPGDSRVVS